MKSKFNSNCMAQSICKKVLTAALAVLFFTAFTAAVASADTVTVCSSGCDYTTIQAAVDNASAGDVITVRDGTYSENVNVCERLTIRSENGSASTTVQAADPDDHVFNVTANYVNIYGFTVTGATENETAGILLFGANHCNISENNASKNEVGIGLIDLSDNNTLTNNIASNNECGIILVNSSHCNVENNTANNNTGFEGDENGSPPSTGILILGSHNIIRKNDASNNFIGIAILSGGPTDDIVSANNTIEGNTASNNTMESFQGETLPPCGIILGDADNNTIINNTANSNGECGINLDNSENNIVTDNTANGNHHGGVQLLQESCNNTLTDNSCSDNSYGSGIQLSSSSNDNTLQYNIANGNCVGIGLDSSSNNALVNNTANSNTPDSGIRLHYSSNNTLSDNIANGNNDYGIELRYSNNNVLTSNAASLNGDDGIRLNSSSHNNITCNLVQSNADRAFSLCGGSTDNNISFNNIIENGNYNAATCGYEWQFENEQSDDVDAINNWWGTNDEAEISASIYDWNDDPSRGNVTHLPRLDQLAPCAPTPEQYVFTAADAVIALQIAVGSRGYDPRWDVSGDKRVTSLDALMILQAAAGAISL